MRDAPPAGTPAATHHEDCASGLRGLPTMSTVLWGAWKMGRFGPKQRFKKGGNGGMVVPSGPGGRPNFFAPMP